MRLNLYTASAFSVFAGPRAHHHDYPVPAAAESPAAAPVDAPVDGTEAGHDRCAHFAAPDLPRGERSDLADSTRRIPVLVAAGRWGIAGTLRSRHPRIPHHRIRHRRTPNMTATAMPELHHCPAARASKKDHAT